MPKGVLFLILTVVVEMLIKASYINAANPYQVGFNCFVLAFTLFYLIWLVVWMKEEYPL